VQSVIAFPRPQLLLVVDPYIIPILRCAVGLGFLFILSQSVSCPAAEYAENTEYAAPKSSRHGVFIPKHPHDLLAIASEEGMRLIPWISILPKHPPYPPPPPPPTKEGKRLIPWIQLSYHTKRFGIHYPAFHETGPHANAGVDYIVNEHITAGAGLGYGVGTVRYEDFSQAPYGTFKDLKNRNGGSGLITGHVTANYADFYVDGGAGYYHRTDDKWKIPDEMATQDFATYSLKTHGGFANLEGGTHVVLGDFDINPLATLTIAGGRLSGSNHPPPPRKTTTYHQSFRAMAVGGGFRISTKIGEKGNITPSLGVAVEKAVAISNRVTASNPVVELFQIPVNYHPHPQIETGVTIGLSPSVSVGLDYNIEFDAGKSRDSAAVSVTWIF